MKTSTNHQSENDTQRRAEKTQRGLAIEFAGRSARNERYRSLNQLMWERNNVWQGETKP